MFVRVFIPAAIPINGLLMITNVGQGLALANSPRLFNFSQPFGATGRATFQSPTAIVVDILSGSFASHQFIEFTISGLTNPAASHPSQSVTVEAHFGGCCSSSTALWATNAVSGSYPAIIDEITSRGSSGFTQPPSTNAPGPDGSFERALLWSTAQLSVARVAAAATSVGNVAIFAGGSTRGDSQFAILFFERLLLSLLCQRYM